MKFKVNDLVSFCEYPKVLAKWGAAQKSPAITLAIAAKATFNVIQVNEEDNTVDLEGASPYEKLPLFDVPAACLISSKAAKVSDKEVSMDSNLLQLAMRQVMDTEQYVNDLEDELEEKYTPEDEEEYELEEEDGEGLEEGDTQDDGANEHCSKSCESSGHHCKCTQETPKENIQDLYKVFETFKKLRKEANEKLENKPEAPKVTWHTLSPEEKKEFDKFIKDTFYRSFRPHFYKPELIPWWAPDNWWC